jgi:hypothetical protein
MFLVSDAGNALPPAREPAGSGDWGCELAWYGLPVILERNLAMQPRRYDSCLLRPPADAHSETRLAGALTDSVDRFDDALLSGFPSSGSGIT